MSTDTFLFLQASTGDSKISISSLQVVKSYSSRARGTGEEM